MKKNILDNILTFCCFILSFGLLSFIFNHLFKFCLYDDWSGRGLYPGIAFSRGFDLYNVGSGPYVTTYGWGTALFYSICGFAKTPDGAIATGYILNICLISFALIGLAYFTFIKSGNKSETMFLSIYFFLITISFLLIEKTTFTFLYLHADTPAIIFLLFSVMFFIIYSLKKSFIFLNFVCFFLVLSIWAKTPVLPCILFPAISFLLEKDFRQVYKYFASLIVWFSLTYLISSYFYGNKDMLFYLFENHSNARWSSRNHLFDGSNAEMLQMNYFEAIPLIIKFFVMYFEEYWYFFLTACLCFKLSFQRTEFQILFRCTSILYFLLLPPCLAALAHFGGVENSLLFVNTIGSICISLITLNCILHFFPNKILKQIVLTIIIGLLFLPSIRKAKSSPNISESAHQQAYHYLKKGKKDIFFGWYPIAHVLANEENLTSIEIPIWVGMSKPEYINFSLDDFPNESCVFATCQVGYGKTVLKQYLGELVEIPPPNELDKWRLFKAKK